MSDVDGHNIVIIQVGKWWIVEAEDIGIATQGKSKEEAVDKMQTRIRHFLKRTSSSRNIAQVHLRTDDLESS